MATHIATAHSGKLTEVVLGRGQFIVSHTTDYRGETPALVFTPAPIPGIPGAGFVPTEQMQIAEGSVVLAFENMDSILRHLDRINSLVRAIELKETP